MKHLLALLLAMFVAAAPSAAQDPFVGPPAPNAPAVTPAPASNGPAPGFNLSFTAGDDRQSLGSAIEIMLLMTVLAMAPAIVMTMTSFTRIVVVLSFLKRAMSMQDLPPTLVTTGFAVFMTIFIMKPVVSDIYDQAYQPYVDHQIEWREAAERATLRMNQFMLAQTREDDVALILELSRTPRPQTALETPFHITVPAFVLSEVKTAFQMGFVLFLPFVVIDLVISSILVSMGMFTLPPIVVSTPLKLLLFILVGGWDLVVASLAQSFAN
ncbi:MAG: flagellar type III secretion system pore protein FliP [Planctomycetes bacterium]|nr:flagellar type III secretion system pore protein FliP [Planctomycetota bacterium]